MNYKIVIFPLFLVTCLINQASPNCQQQPKVKHGQSSSSNVFSFNNLFNQQESSNNQQTWNQNLFFNPFELTFKAPGQTSQSHLGDNSNGLLVNPKVNNLASALASSSSSGASSSSSKVNGGQIHATNRQLFGLFDFFQEQPPKVNVNSHGQTVNKGTSVAPKQPSQGMKPLLTPLETLKSSSESTSSSSTESTSFSEFPLLFSGLVSATDAQDDADDLLGLIQQHQSQWGQNLQTQLTGQKQGTKVPKVNSGASSLSSSSSFASSSSFPDSSLSLGHSPQQKLPKDDTIKARQQLQNSGKILQDSISSSVASSPFNFDQLLSGEGPKNGQGIEKDSLTSIFFGDSSSSDSASATSSVKSINQINQLQPTADLIKSLQQKQSNQQQNIEKIESQSPYEQLLSSSGLTPQLLQSLSSSISSSSSSASSVPKVNNLGHISKSHEKHPAVDLNSFFQQQSDNQNRHSIVDRGNKGALNIPTQVEQKTKEQTKPVKSSVTIPLLTFPSTSKPSSGRPERSGSANIHSQNSKSGQTGTSARINNHGSVKKPVTNTEHDTLFSSFSSSFTPIFNSALQIQSNGQQNQKLTDQQKPNKDQSHKSSQTSIPPSISSFSSSSTDSSSLSNEQIQKLNRFDLLKLIQQQNNKEKTNSNGDLAPNIGQNSDKNKHQPPINTNKPTSSSTSKLSTSQTVLPLSSINAKLQSDSLINSVGLAALSSSNLGVPITTANNPLINGKTNVPLSAAESESSSDSSSTSGSSLIHTFNKPSQTPILPSSTSLSSSTSSKDSVISNQQIINQNLHVKNEKSTDHRQTQTDQNKQYNKQKTPSIIDSQSSLQLHSKSDLKKPIQSSPIEQVTEKINNQQKSISALPTTTSSLTALTDLSSLSTDQIQKLSKSDLITLLQNQNNKEKPTSQESLVSNIRQNSGKSKPTGSSDTESSSVTTSNSAFLPFPSTTKLSKQMSSSYAESSGTHLPLSVTASEAAIAAALSSLYDLNDDDDDDDDDDDETEDEESTEESSEIVKQSVRPVQTPIQSSSSTDLSSLSTARIQKLNTEDLLKLIQPQNRKDKTTSEESSAPIIGQNSDKSKNRPTANTKPSPSSSSSAHSTSPPTFNSGSNNNKHKSSAARIKSEAGSMLTASSLLSDEQIKSLTASPSTNAKSSSAILDSLTKPPHTKLPKQLPTGADVSSEEDLPLTATDLAIGAGTAIATASALSSSDSDSSSALLPLLQSSSLGDLSLQNDNQDSTGLKSGSIVKPLNRPTQTLIVPSALSSSSLSTDLSSLTTEQIQQLTPQDLVKLLKQPNNQIDKTLKGIITENADQISAKNTKPLTISSGTSPSSSFHSALPSSPTLLSTPSLHVQPAASIQSELTDSLSTSALASASALSWLSAEQINQLTAAELLQLIQQQNNQRDSNSQRSKSSNSGKDTNQASFLTSTSSNPALFVTPTSSTASIPVSTKQIRPSSSVNLNNGLVNQQAAIVGSLNTPSQTPSSLSSSTSSQDRMISNQKTSSGIILQNADLISGKNAKPLKISSGRSPSFSSLSGPTQSELADSLSTSALASALTLSWLSAEQINQLTEAELMAHIQQQNNQRDNISQKSSSSNGEKINEKGKNQEIKSMQAQANSALLVKPTSALEHSGPSSSPVSTGPQIQPTSSVNVNSVLQNRNNGLTNQQAIVGLTNKSSQTPIFPSSTSLSSSGIISNQQIINQNLGSPVKNDKSNQRQTQTEQNKQNNKQKTPSPMGSQSGLQSPPSATEQVTEKSKSQQKLNTSVSPKTPSSSLTSSTPLFSTATSPIQLPIGGISVKSSNNAISSPSPTSSLTFSTDLSTLSTEQIQQLTKADLIALLQNQNNKEKPTSQESLVPNVRQNSDSATAIATTAALTSLSDSDETDDEESTEETSDIIRQSVRPVQTPITSSSSPTDSLSTEQIQKLNTADLLQLIKQQNSETKITSQKTLAPIIGQSSDNSANQPTVSPNVESPTSLSASLASTNLSTLPTTSESFTPNIEKNSDKSKNKPTVSSDTDFSSISSSNSAGLTLPSKLSKQIPSSSEIDLPLTATDVAIATGTAIATANALSSSASSLLSAAQVQSSNLHSQQQNNDATKQKTNLSGPSNKSSQTSIAHTSTISPSPNPSQDSMTSNAQIITPNLNKPTLSDQTSSTSTQSNLLSQPSPSHSSDHQQVETNSEKPIQAKHNSQKSQQKTPSRVDTPHSKSTPHSLVSLPFSLSTNSGQLHSSNRQPSIGSTRLKHQQHGKNQNINPTESQTNKGATNRPSIIQSSKVPIDASKTLASTSTSLHSPPAIHQQTNQQTQPSESSTSLLQSNQPESQIKEQSEDETLTRQSTLNGVSTGLFTGQGLNRDSLTSSSASNSALQSQLDMNKQSHIIQNEQNNKWTASSQVKTPSRGRTEKNVNLNNPIIDAGSSSFLSSSSSLLLDKQIEVPETTDLTKSGQQQTTRLSENTSLSPSQTGNGFQLKSDEQHDLDALIALAKQRNNEKSTNSGQTMQFTDQNLAKQGLSTPRINSDLLSSSSAPKLSSGNAAKTLLSPNNEELSIIHQMGSDKDSSSTLSSVSSLLSAEQIQQLTPNDLIKLIQQKNKETTDQEVINGDKFEKSSQTSVPSSVSSLLSAERIQQLTPTELLQMVKQNDKEKTNSAENLNTKVAQSSNKDNSKSTVSTDARSSSSAPTVNAAVFTFPSTSILSKQIPSSTTVSSEIDLPLATATATAAATTLLSASALDLPLLQSSSKDDLQLENADATKLSNIARPSAIPLTTSITSSPSSFLSTDLSSNEQIQKLKTDELLKLIQEQTNKEKTNGGAAPNVGQNGNKNKNHPTINTATATQSSPSSLSPSTSKLLTPQSVIPLPSMNEQLQSDSLISSAALPLASLSSSLSSLSTTANSPVINGKTDVPLSAIESESLSDTSSTSDSSSISALNKLSKTPILPSSTSLSSSTSSQDSVMSNQQILNQNLNLPVKNEKSNQRKTQTEQKKHSNEQKTPSLTETTIESSLQPHFESDLKTPIQSSPIEQVNENIKNQQKSSSALPTTSSLTSLTDLSNLSTDQIHKLSKSDLITLLQNQNNKEKPTSQESLVSNIEQNSNKPKLNSDAESSSASSFNLALSTLPATSKLSKQIPNSSDVSSKTVLPLSATASEAASLSSSSDSDSDAETDKEEESTEESSDIIRQSVRPVQTPITFLFSPTDLFSSSIERTQKPDSENAFKLTQPQNHKDKTTSKESLAPVIGQNHDKSPNQPTVSPNVKYPSSASASLSSSNLLTLPSTEPASSSKTINANKIPSSTHVSSGMNSQSVSELGFTTGTASESSSLPSTDSSSLSGEQIPKHSTQDQNKLLKQQNNQLDKTSEGRETQNADQISGKDTKTLTISSGGPSSSPHSSQFSASFSSSPSSTSTLLVQPSGPIPSASPAASSSASAFDSASALSALSFLSAEQINQLTAAELIQLIQQQNNQRDSNSQGRESSLSTNLSSLSTEQIQQLTPEGLIKLLKQRDNQSIKTSQGSETNTADQIKDTKSTAISIGSPSTSTLLITPSESSDSSSSAIVELGSQHQNKGMNDQQKSIVRPTSASSSLSAQQQTTATDQVKQIQNKNIELNIGQASNIDKIKAPSQESSPSVTNLSSLTTEQIRQLTATELLKLLKQQNNQWTTNGQGGESPNNEQISNTGNKQSTSTMSTPSVRPSPSPPSPPSSSTVSSSSTSSLLASAKQTQQTNKLKQQNVGLTNQQSLNHVLLNKPYQVPISSVLPSSSSVAHKDQSVDNQSTKVSIKNTNQSPKDSLLPPASAISSGLASFTTSFDAGQINPYNQASTQDLSQENSASSHSFNQQAKKSSLSPSSSSSSESPISIASADKIQLSKQQQLDLFKLIQQTQYNSKESAALASQFGISRGTTPLSPISSSSSTQSTESVPSSISLSTTNTEQVYFSKQQIVAYLIALIQAQLAKSSQGASPVSSSSSSFSSTYDSTQNYQTDEQQIVVLLIEILQQQQQNDHPTSSLLSLLSKNLFIISELPPQLLSLITSLFTTCLSSKAEHLSTINNQMSSADLKRLLQQIKQQSDVEKQLKSQIGSTASALMAGQIHQASSISSDTSQRSSASLSNPTLPLTSELPKQLSTGADVSSEEDLPLTATDLAIGAGTAIATASALSSSDSDSSSALLPLLQSSSLGDLSLQNDNQDSTGLKSGSIVKPLNRPAQTLIVPSALSSSSLSTDLSSLTTEQIQQLTPEDLVKLLKQPNNKLDKTSSEIITQNADLISGKDTKPLTASSGTSPSSSFHSVLPSSPTQSELADSLSTSALASASALSWLSAEQINQLTESELIELIQQQQNNQRDSSSQRSKSSNSGKDTNQASALTSTSSNPALFVTPTPSTASIPVSTKQIRPSSSVNLNNGLVNQQAAIVGSLNTPSQTPSSLSSSTSSQDSIISNQQIINQNLNSPVKNDESVDQTQTNLEKITKAELNKQSNEQKTPSPMGSQPSLQSHPKVDLKTPIKSSLSERVKQSNGASATTPSSSLTSSTPLVSTAIESSSDSSPPSVSSLITAIPISDQKNKAPTKQQTGIVQPSISGSSTDFSNLSTDQIQQLSKTDLVALLQNQNNKETPTSQETLVPNIRQNSDTPTINSDAESSSTSSTSSSNLALLTLPLSSKLSSKIPINSGGNLEKDLPLSPTVPATVTAKASSLSSADSDSDDETESTEELSDIIRQSARPVQPPITSSSSPTDLSSLSAQTIKKSNTDDLLKLTQSQNHKDKTSEESSATIIGQNNDKSVNQPTINTITPTPFPPLSLSPANPVLSTSPLTSKLSTPQSVLPLTSINDGVKSDSSISSAAFPLTTFAYSNQGSPSSTAHSSLINGKTDGPLSVTESESTSKSSTSDSSLISELNKLSKTSIPPSSLSLSTSSQDSEIKQQNDKEKTNSAENFSTKVAQSSNKGNSKSTVSTDARSSSSSPTVNAAVLTFPSTSILSKQIPSSNTMNSEIDLPLASATANAAATAILSASALSSLDSDSSSVDLPLLQSSSKDDLQLENADSPKQQPDIARPSTLPVPTSITSSPSSFTSSSSLSTDLSSNEQTQKLNAADQLKLVQKQTNKAKTNESLAPNIGQNINKGKNQQTINPITPISSSPSALSESTPVISTSPSTSSQNSVISNQQIINQNLDLPVKNEKSSDQRLTHTNSEKLTQTEQNKQSNGQKTLSLNDSPSSLQSDVKANLQTPIKSSASTSAVEQVTEKSKNGQTSNTSASPTKPSSSLPTIPPPIIELSKKSDDTISSSSTTKSSLTSATDLSTLSTEQIQQLTKADLIALLQNQNNKEKPTSQETLVPNIRQNSDTPTINSDAESSSTSTALSSNLDLLTSSKPSKQIPNNSDVSSKTVLPLSAKAKTVPIPLLTSDSSSPVSSMLLTGHIKSSSSTDLASQQPNNDLTQQKTNLSGPLNKPSQTSITHSSSSSPSSIPSQDSTISNPQIITPDLSIFTLTNQGSSSNLALLTLPATSKLSKQLPSNDVSSKTDLSSSATVPATAIATAAVLSPISALSSSGSDSDSSSVSLPILQASSSDELGSQNDNEDSTDQQSDMVRPSEKAAQTLVALISPSPSYSSSSSTDLSSTEQTLSTQPLKVIQQKNKEKGASQESIAPKIAQISNKNDNQPSISGSASLKQQNNKFDKTSKESKALNAEQINDRDTKPLTISSGELTSSSPHSAQSSVLPSTLTLPLTLPSASLASPNLLTLPTTSEESFALNIQQNSDKSKNKPTVSSETDSSSTSSSDSAVLTLPTKLSKQIPSSLETDLPLPATDAVIATGTAIVTAPVLSSTYSGSFPVTLPLSKSNNLGLQLDAYDSTDQQSDIVRQSKKPTQITIASTSVPSTSSSSSTDLFPIATAQNQKLTTIDLLKQIQKQNNKEKTTSEEGLASNIGLDIDQSKKQPTMSTSTSLPSSTGKPSTSIPSFLTLPSTTKLSSSESPLRSQSNTNKQITSSDHVNAEKDLSLLGTTTAIDTASAFSFSNPDSSSLQSSEKIQPTSSGNLHLQHQNKGTANQKSGIVTTLDKLTQTSIAPSSLSSSSLSTDLSSLTTEQIQQLTPQDLIKLLQQPNNQLDNTSSGIITQNADQISGKDTKTLTISSGGPSSSPHSSQFSSSFSSSPSSTSTLLVQPSGPIPSASPAASSAASAFDSASALSALSFLSAEQINQLTAAELIQLIQQQNNQRDSNSQGRESSLSTNLSSLSTEQIQQLTPEGLIKLLKQRDNQSIKTSQGSETNKADQINDKGTKPIAISSDATSSFSSQTTPSTSALLTSPSTSKISSDFNSESFNNKQMTNSDHMSSKTGSFSSASKLSLATASALLAGQIPQASSVDSLSDLKQQHDGVIMQQSGPSSLSAQPSQTQIAVPSASLDSTSLSNEQMQKLSQADLIKLLKEQNNKFGKISQGSETNKADQSKDTKSTAISTGSPSTSTLLISPSESSDSSPSAIVELGSQHQNKGMNDQQKSIVRPTSASSSLSAPQQTTATDQVKQIQNKNIELNIGQASNIDKIKAPSQESSPSVTNLSSLTTEQIRQLTATELLKLLKKQNNQWTTNGQGGESPNNVQISNTGNKQSTSTMSTPSVRPSPSSSASSTSSSSSTSSLLASAKQNQQTNKLKQQNVGLTNQQSLNHVLLNKPYQVPISSVLPSSSSVAHKDQSVDNQSTKVSIKNTNQSPKDSLLPPASAISSGLASFTTSFDAGQINPYNQASTQDLSQENSASSHSFNQQGKQSSSSTHTRPNQEVKHTTKPGESSSATTTASSSSSSSTSALTPLLTSSFNPTSSVQVNTQHNQKDRGTSGKQASDFDTGKLADVSSLSSSSASLTPSTTLDEKSSLNQKLTLDDLMKLVQQQQQNNQWNTNSQGDRASVDQLLKAIGSINESAHSSSSSSSIPLLRLDQKQMEHTDQFNQNKKTDSQLMKMNKQGSINPIISEDTSASTSASSSSSSESSSSTASADKIQLSKQQQLDLFKLIQQTQYNSKESAALASQFGISRGTTPLSPISSSSSTQSTESVPSSISLSTTNTEQVYFSKQQIVAYLIALIQAQLAKSPQGASPVSSSSSSFSSTYDSTQNYQTDEQQIVVLLIEILQQQQENDHPTSSLLSLLSKNLFIISELPPQLLSLITSLFTTSLSSKAEHLSTINNQMSSADLKRLLQQIKQQSDVEKQLKSQIGSQGEQQLDSSQLISALSRLSSMPQTNAPSVGINPANVQSNKQWNLNSQQQAAIKDLQSSQQYKPLDDPSAAAASSSMDSQLFEYPILMDPTNTKGLIPTMEDIAEQGIATLENFASDLLGR